MAKTLTKNNINTGDTIFPGHVTQLVDAFTGIEEYDISISGSLNITGSTNVNGGITSTTLNTGQGDHELYAMNQNVTSTSKVVFDSVNLDTLLQLRDIGNLNTISSPENGMIAFSGGRLYLRTAGVWESFTTTP